MPTSSDDHRRPGIRWWPAVAILAGFAAALARIWLAAGSIRQDRNVRTMFAILLTSACCCSGSFSRRGFAPVRLIGGAVVLAAVAAGIALFRIEA